MIPVLGSQPAGDVSHKPGGRLPLLSARPAVNPAEGCYQFCCLVNRGTMSVNSLPQTVTRQRRGCDLSPSAPESSTLTTRLPSQPRKHNTLETVNAEKRFKNVHELSMYFLYSKPNSYHVALPINFK